MEVSQVVASAEQANARPGTCVATGQRDAQENSIVKTGFDSAETCTGMKKD